MTIEKKRRLSPAVPAVKWTGANLGEIIDFAGKHIDPPSERNGMKLYVFGQFLWEEVTVGRYIIRNPGGSYEVVPAEELEDA